MFISAKRLPENIIMTDDPMRVEMLCAHHLDGASLVSDLRGMKSYSGTYNGVPVALVSCGYGQSAAMLCFKEACDLGARRILFLGECMSLSPRRSLMDMVVAEGNSPALAAALKTAAVNRCVTLFCDEVTTNDMYTILEFINSADAKYASAFSSSHGSGIIDYAHAGIAAMSKAMGSQLISLLVVSEVRQADGTRVRIEESVRQSGFHMASQLAFDTLC